MILFVVALFLVPIVEIAVMVQVGQWIGAWEMIALLLMVTFLGAWIVKQQGTGAWRRIRTDLAIGRMPGAALIDGALILAAGVLFLIPGFVTDVLAVLLLVPPARALVRGRLARRFKVSASLHAASPTPGYYDARSRDAEPPGTPPEPPELGR